jgi:RNA polymerase sigma-70 factor (ECF subfamily)
MGFASTQWSMVLAARAQTTAAGAAALGELCRAYWRPLYGYARRRGYSAEDAQDLTQSYFSRLLEKGLLEHAEEGRGRFRSFLLASLKNFMANEWRREHTLKRGGGVEWLSLDDTARAETAYLAAQASSPATPEQLYERSWALAVLERVVAQLASEFDSAGKASVFEGLKGFLTGDGGELKYSQAASALAMSEGAARVAVHRMRGRFRDLLRTEIARTVADPQDAGAVDAELRFLMDAL